VANINYFMRTGLHLNHKSSSDLSSFQAKS